jgi:homoserine O-acetyltransferase
LLVPGTSGNRHSYDAHIGPGKTFDTDKYFVIGADPIGGGTSSQPKDGLGTAFPRYTIRDMVRAQHEMVANGLGIAHLLAVGGGSMGSFQTVEWGINFPDAMSGLIMIVPAARSDHHFAAVVDAFEATITLDPKYQGGKYNENPVEGIRRAALIYFPWVVSDEYLATLSEPAYEEGKRAAGDTWVKSWDANSMLWRYFASRNFDASKPFGGDMMKALGLIKAPVLLLPSMTDRTIPGYLTRELYRGLRGQVTYAEIPSIRGHSAGSASPGTAEYAYVSEKIRIFLAGLQK